MDRPAWVQPKRKRGDGIAQPYWIQPKRKRGGRIVQSFELARRTYGRLEKRPRRGAVTGGHRCDIDCPAGARGIHAEGAVQERAGLQGGTSGRTPAPRTTRATPERA